uniref:small nuclear ribonucleoprotein G-like n=1 Tax=Solea senegalensis TaxID=28829 RepID=UPI001CD885A6|nr:small nuclear ribonucleoprotein G-like [Solea senegalensis]
MPEPSLCDKWFRRYELEKCVLFFCLPVKLNGGRHVQGILRGFDPFMNLVVDDSVEMGPGGQQNVIGMVVIRGNSIIMLEALERV